MEELVLFSAAESLRGNPCLLDKRPIKPRIVIEAAGLSGIARGHALVHQVLRMADAFADDVVIDRETELFLENTGKIEFVDEKSRGKVV